ncbi:BAI1-associated protein 3 isoform X2 [Periplaneta americana]|uniref:BAI1-associated protein 3 isoform X2 n=1 Tax=Periplaneta americana TaxID=6978 RepID=UPI0037E9B251
MSFFNSLQQYVTSSVANLSLSPKRFSLSRDSSAEGSTDGTGSHPPLTPGATGSCSSVTSGRSASAGNVVVSPAHSGPSMLHGFPKVVPPPGTVTPPHGRSLSARRRTLECPPPPGLVLPPGAGPPRRLGSFRKSNQQQQQQQQATTPGSAGLGRQPLMFCRRRQSWPEVDQQATSGVQETDGSFFESFTALSWKQENRRLMAMQEVEGRAEDPPPSEQSVGIKPTECRIHKKEIEQLYVEVLYTITNKVGASTGQYSHYKEDLYSYAQEAFGISSEIHRKFMAIASEEKPPIVVLNVIVLEAEGLEAKDANGFSDPYCMLGIQPGNVAPPSPQPSSSSSSGGAQRETPPGSPRNPATGAASSRAMSDSGVESESSGKHDSPHEKLRKHHSFRLSFKRKEHGSYRSERREHRDSLSAAVPAKFIRATTVKPQTLNPRWNEKFRFDIDDVASDILHLDIWDHDDESSVFDAVSKLNEVRGVKGLGRFFKQIAQSARSGSQDDFLGCVNVPLQDIPSTGLDCWYQLEARTQRSNVQGRIRLKLWLSTREDRGNSEEDNWSEIRQQERLHAIFISYELAHSSSPSWEWSGELPHVALTILHQHAIQGDVTDLQLAMVRWIAYSKKSLELPLDYRILFRLLQDLDQQWNLLTLTKEEEEYLAESFNMFLDHSLQLLRKHRQLFLPHNRVSMCRLEYLLRCLGLISTMKAFWKCCPFNKEIRGEIIMSLKKGTLEWYEEIHSGQHLSMSRDRDTVIQGLVHLITLLLVDLQKGLDFYNNLFETTNGVPYFSVVYKQLEKMIHGEIGPQVTALCIQMQSMDIGTMMEDVTLPQEAEVATPIFELYLAMQEMVSFREHLPVPDQKALSINLYYEWFEPAVDKWLDVAKFKAVHRIRKAAELNRVCTGDLIVKHSTSAVDATSCFYQIKEFWRQLAWPDLVGSYNFVLKIIDCITSAAVYYADLTHQKLQDTGYYEDTAPFKISDEMCVTVNDLEYVRRSLSVLGAELHVETVLEAVEAATGDAGRQQWRQALYAMLEGAINQLEARALQVINRVAAKMRPALKKAMFHLAWSPDSLPTPDAISPLLEYLDAHLVNLNAALLPRNFERVLADVWDVSLLELGQQMDGNAGEKMSMFYERLYEALEILVDFFHAEQKGLPLEALKSATYWSVEQRLQYHKTDTEQLVSLYYQQRLQDQLSTEVTEYGVLSVRAYFNHDSLCVEVLNARDVIPLDPNGFSDPFVIIELLPRKVFAHCSEQQTNVQKKTLNPMFDECFEFSVTLEQCKSEGAMILFTVMDHDVLTSNDFAGEAFLSLHNIPGVDDNNTSIDNFHGLKTVDLCLMHQKNRNHPILQTLETRAGDKMAQDFVKKQKLRISNS